MLILFLLGMYFDAAVVFVTKSSLFFRLAVAILCLSMENVVKTLGETLVEISFFRPIFFIYIEKLSAVV